MVISYDTNPQSHSLQKSTQLANNILFYKLLFLRCLFVNLSNAWYSWYPRYARLACPIVIYK